MRGCRGIFLDYGELEALTRLESQWSQQAPPPAAPPAPQPPHGQAYPAPPAPAWGAPHHGGHHYGHRRDRGFGRMLFSS